MESEVAVMSRLHLVFQFRYGVRVEGERKISMLGSSWPRSVSSEL